MFPMIMAAKVVIGAAMAVSSHHAPAAVAHTHVVHAGETLWGISAPQGHNWQHLYAINRDKIKDPDMIYPGQNLRMNGKVTEVPAETTSAVRSVVHNAPKKVWGVTYGYPNKCGDGDGDGWDMPCSKLFPHTNVTSMVRRSADSSSTSRGTAVNTHYGTYSFAGLEALWISAGGPSWAASHAASIAECESGGRTSAYNPSGATGLWQILGSVVPGNLYNAYTNALNAVAKFNASGQTFAQWVCQ